MARFRFSKRSSAEIKEDLVGRLRHREPQALADCYDLFGHIVYSLIVHLVDDAAVAEDLVLETFARFWTRISVFTGPQEALKAWLLTIAYNCALDYRCSARGEGGSLAARLVELVGGIPLRPQGDDLRQVVDKLERS